MADKTSRKKEDSKKRKRPAAIRTTEPAPSTEKESFPIVALGSSAGGLEALEGFFRNLPPGTGAAFVVISHLDPKHPSMMAELIARFTRMEVQEAADGVEVEAGHVYVIPPNRDLSIFHGSLQLTHQEQSGSLRMPIDGFLRSLAEDRGDRAIAVILSGTGTDGSMGVRALQPAGGVVFVQDPADAKYDGMPRSAIQTGLADHVLPVDEIARQLAILLGGYPIREGESLDEAMPNVIRKVLMVVRSRTGHDFSLYRKKTISRRIRRRMSVHNIQDSADYIRYLREHPEEAHQLFKELLINVTNFFREPEAFDSLKETVLPELLQDKPHDLQKAGPEQRLLRLGTSPAATKESFLSTTRICWLNGAMPLLGSLATE